MREWVLLNPGPANTSKTVRHALLMPDLCHREPECFDMVRSIRDRLVRLAGGGDLFSAVLLNGSGTASVEAVLASAVPPEGALLVVDNGVYGDRMARIARAHRIPVHLISRDVTTPIEPAAVDAVLAQHLDVSHVALVHHETTTGLLNPLAAVAAVVARHGRRLIVDATSSLFGEPLEISDEGIDFVTASAAKCVQAIPGVAFVLARRSALEALRDREPRSVYLDLYTHWVAQEADNTPFTPAVQVMHALEQALVELEEPRCGDRIRRYAENARVLRQGMTRLGFEILVPAQARSNILTTFRLPAAVTYDALHDAMKQRGYVIYGGQGAIRTYAFRVSNIGTLTPADMDKVVSAFASCLEELGAA